ncbi:hypothetical protein ACR4XJ_11120 [Nitratidesulfovibrio sp. D1]|uniref:hypothetical protein n=1 Tax=Nitratidesulfovibrio sp. D1 TaxID=3440151 RepID=UPI003EBFCFEB
MSKNTKQTSATVASHAGKALNDPNASASTKSLAASALSQRSPDKQTGAEMEAKAGRVLQNERSSNLAQEFAASIVSQSNKKR